VTRDFLAGCREAARHLPGLAAVVRLARRLTDRQARALHRLPPAEARRLLQTSAFTLPDRYPGLFGFVRLKLAETPAPRLLSYGCSTGEEAFALRDYFPDADITAIDINAHNIAKARARLRTRPDSRMHFSQAASPDACPADSFDAIFCMAVMRHGGLGAELPERCDHLIDFATVEALAAGLSRCLKPGGYLAIWHANFRFSDMAAATDFRTALRLPWCDDANHPLYGADNRRIHDAVYTDAVFRKVENQAVTANPRRTRSFAKSRTSRRHVSGSTS
jgi:SAM-dependent methyltransferase